MTATAPMIALSPLWLPHPSPLFLQGFDARRQQNPLMFLYTISIIREDFLLRNIADGLLVLGMGWGHELADSVENNFELGVILFFKGSQFAG